MLEPKLRPRTWVQWILAGILILCSACGGNAPAPTAASAPPSISQLHPPQTQAGQVFNVQPDGQAAIAIDCDGATVGSTILWNGQRLKTVVGSEKLVTAVVPKELFTKPGEASIQLQNDRGKSNQMLFFIR